MTDSASPALRRRVGFWWVWPLALAIALAIPFTSHSAGLFSILNLIAINIVFALSYNMLLGEGGLLSFGHAVFYGFGGFFAMHAMVAIGAADSVWAHFPVLGLPLIGFVGGAVVAIVIGWPICKHGGLAFAMITLGLGMLVASGANLFPSFFGGTTGIFGDRTVGPAWFGWKLVHAVDVYWFMVFWVFVAALGMWAFTRTPLGRLANAMRDNAMRLRFIGYEPRNVRFLLFIAAGAFAGMAGAMAAVNEEIANASSLSLTHSGLVLLMAAIGGFGAFYGPIIGAVLVTLMNSSLSNYTNASEFYIGLVFLSIVTFASRGMAGGLEKGWAALRGGHVRQRIPGWLVQWLGVLLIILGLIAFVETIYQVQNGPDVMAAALGISFSPRVIWSWIVILVLCGGGYGILRLARRAYAADEPDETGGTPTHA